MRSCRWSKAGRLRLVAAAHLVAFVAACSASSAPPNEGREPASTTTPATDVPPTGAPAATPTSRSAGASVWVANEGGRRLTLVDPAAGVAVSSTDTPGRPHNVWVGPDGVVAATLPAEGALFLRRPDGATKVVPLGGQPHDVKAFGSRFLIANEGTMRLHVVDDEGREALQVDLPFQPHDLAVSPDGRTAWVSLDGTDQLAVVDLMSSTVRRFVRTGASPHDLLFSPAGDVWVTNWDGPVRVYSADGAPKGSVALGRESHHLAFSDDGSVWVTDNAARRVFVVDAQRLAIVDSLPTPAGPHHVVVAGDRVVVADGFGGIVLFDRTVRREVGTVATGADPHGVSVVP